MGTGEVVQTLSVGGVTRSYRLAVPPRYRSGTPAPLVLLYHGSGSDAVQTSLYTGMPERAARAGYLVATPDALGEQWHLSTPNAPNPDLAFTSAVLDSLSARYCIDPARTYAAGISLGSEFAAIVACAVPNRIAAIGLVAAEFLLRPCTGPVPAVAFHGTADPLVAYADGGVGRSLPGIRVRGADENMADWAHLDGCRPKASTTRVASDVVRRRWRGCARGSSVVLYTVIAGGHTWPGSPVVLPAAVFGPTTHQVDATGLMIRFFGQHSSRR